MPSFLRKGSVWMALKKKARSLGGYGKDWILFWEQKDQQKFIQKLFPELLPYTKPVSDSGNKTDKAMLPFPRRVRQKSGKQMKNK